MAATVARRSERSTGPGRLEGDRGVLDAALGSGDALLHGAFTRQEGARDLLYRKTGHDAQCERYLLGHREIGMAADEQQP